MNKVYRYHFDANNTIVETGIAEDLFEREQELRNKYPGCFGFIIQVGFKAVQLSTAKRWLSKKRKEGYPVREYIKQQEENK